MYRSKTLSRNFAATAKYFCNIELYLASVQIGIYLFDIFSGRSTMVDYYGVRLSREFISHCGLGRTRFHLTVWSSSF